MCKFTPGMDGEAEAGQVRGPEQVRGRPGGGELEFKAKRWKPAELKLIEEVVSSCGGLTRQELAKTVCELLDWRRANGRLKWRECREWLERLESEGRVSLPVLRRTKPLGATTRVAHSEQGEPGELLVGTVGDVRPVVFEALDSDQERGLWRELVGRYHYLGHKVPFGAQLRYFVRVSRPPGTVVGCVQLSSPAWKIAPRDGWIGWDEPTRRRNLQRIVNQSRFLLLPWVRIRNLASHILAKMVREFPSDWERLYGIRPVLVETLVDRQRFRGTCYRAANWHYLGSTQGRGRMDRRHNRQGASPKDLFVYPLVSDFRQ
ncbi:DUF4338 domain-containing protein, partial [Acidobacteria bacterium AH-259-L09]|nr:DUF4338 domain-containing protein [Acidobacteria bacterium AH-259-L09]